MTAQEAAGAAVALSVVGPVVNEQDNVAPLPWDEARAILTEDLDRAFGEILVAVEPAPFIAGALAQLHLGRLADGSEVTVKLQRPEARTRLLRELEQTELLGSLLRRAGAAPYSPAC